jgi:citrate lyase subunit beta/citryl-CoA lyase
MQLLIESARGLVEVEAIAAAAAENGGQALVFGPGDYAASLGVVEPVLGGWHDRFPGDRWQPARSRIANAAHAFGLEAIDGPYAAFTDEDGLRSLAEYARLLGFTGKWAIHPRQVSVLTDAFTPAAAEIDRARAVLAALEAAGSAGDGVTSREGAMIDAASIRMARRVLALVPARDPSAPIR